jgi:hypothetical protein
VSKRDKLLARIRNNPKQVSIEDLERILLEYGFVKRTARSHHNFYSRGAYIISVPVHRPHVKEVYVRHALAILEQLDEEEGDVDD